MPKQNIQYHLFETYLAVIRNSVGTKMFRNFYMTIEGKKMDATRDGEVSCAYFVSNVLHMFSRLKLIREPHLTVTSTVKDLMENGWKEIAKPRVGAVLVWEKKLAAGSTNAHIGFYVGDDMAVSNLYTRKSPGKHHWTFGGSDGKPARKVEMILWHDALENA